MLGYALSWFMTMGYFKKNYIVKSYRSYIFLYILVFILLGI